ncbi:MAG TPA: hypothetical protein VKM93_19870 [Terriglobia bacterium]|nr:hypothetical protein [Terriglobia bacterium]
MAEGLLVLVFALFSAGARAQDSGALSLLYAAPVTAATCTGRTTTLTLSSVPPNLVTGVSGALTGASPSAWNANPSSVTVSGSSVSYSQTCPSSSYTGGGYFSAGVPGQGQWYVVDMPSHIRLALGDNSDYSGGSLSSCGNTNDCVTFDGLSDAFDNKNETGFDITSWTAAGSSVTLTLSGSPTWSSGPACVFGTNKTSGRLAGGFTILSINGCFPVSSVSGNQVVFTLTGGLSCMGTCTGAGGFVYQVDVASMDAGMLQVQYGLANAPQNLQTGTSGTTCAAGVGAFVIGTGSGGDGKTVTLCLQNSSITPTTAPNNASLAVAGVTVDTGSCAFNIAGSNVLSSAAGQVTYRLGSTQANTCTGHGGTVTVQRFGEYKNSSGGSVQVLEANNVRIRLQATYELREYGQIGSPSGGATGFNGTLDPNTFGTEYYTFYRPDKVFHRFDLTYNNGDSQGPLTVEDVNGSGADATMQASTLKSQNFANDKGESDNGVCGQYPLVPPSFDEVRQMYGATTWQMVTPNRASWYGTATFTNGRTTVTLLSGDNFAAGVSLASWGGSTLMIWTTPGTAQQVTVSSVTGSNYAGGTTLTLTAAFGGTTGTYNWYVGGLPVRDYGLANPAPCTTSLVPSAVGVLIPTPGNLQICSTGPASADASGCRSPYTTIDMPGMVHMNVLRIIGQVPSLLAQGMGTYISNSVNGPTWFEGMRDRIQSAYRGVVIPGDNAPHVVYYDTLRIGDDGLWTGTRQGTQGLADDYAAEYEAPPTPNFTTGTCTNGYGTSCFDQDSGAYQITASSSGSVNFPLSLPSWQSSHAYSEGQAIWDGTNVEVATSNRTSGGSQPNWSSNCPNQGNVCADNGMTWMNGGNRYFHYPAFEVAGWTAVPSTLTVNSTTYHLNTDYVGAANAGGVIIQLLTGDSGTPGFYASGLRLQGSQGSSVVNATISGQVTVGGNTIVQ